MNFALGCLLVLLSSVVPMRVLSLSEIELEQRMLKKPVLAQRDVYQGGKDTSEALKHGDTVAFKALSLDAESARRQGVLNPAQSEIDEWLTWAQGRTPQVLFSISDVRGMPTIGLFKVMATLQKHKRFSVMLSAWLIRVREEAPPGLYGEVESVLKALLVLSSTLSYAQLVVVLEPIESIGTLVDCAGLLQRSPEEKTNLCAIHRETLPVLLPQLYERVQEEGLVAWRDACWLLQNNVDTYIYWLSDGRSIRRDWQSRWWDMVGKVFPIRYVLHMGSAALIFSYMALCLGVVLIVCSWIPVDPTNRSLRVALSLVLCVLLMFLWEWSPTSAGQDLDLVVRNPQQLPKTDDNHEFQEIHTPMNDAPMESLHLVLLFLGIQLLIFVWSYLQLKRIAARQGEAGLKLELLENEEMLFDMGLYVGLAGTVMSLIFMVMGEENKGLIAAYTSTLFGILEVALFKICLLRPLKQDLIVAGRTS